MLQFGEDPQELQTKVVGFLYQMRIDAEVKCAATPTRRDHSYTLLWLTTFTRAALLHHFILYGPASPAPPLHHAPDKCKIALSSRDENIYLSIYSIYLRLHVPRVGVSWGGVR